MRRSSCSGGGAGPSIIAVGPEVLCGIRRGRQEENSWIEQEQEEKGTDEGEHQEYKNELLVCPVLWQLVLPQHYPLSRMALKENQV
jgi:hypothetical protein